MLNNSGVKVQRDKLLLNDLFKIMILRNEAVHSGSFSAQEMVKLRTLLYDGNVYKRFFKMIN